MVWSKGKSLHSVTMKLDGLVRQNCGYALRRPASSQARGAFRAAAPPEKERPSTAIDRTRLVQHFGPDAQDVEHMYERYVDEQLPGAVQVPQCEDPRPRLAAPLLSC